MRKIKLLIISLLLFIMLPMFVSAASGSVKVTGTSQAVIGNNVTCTVTLSADTAIGSWNLSLNYDKSFLQLVSTDSEGGGNRMVNSSATGVKSKSYTFKFKALKQGSTTVSVSSYEAYAFADLSEISLSSSGKTIKILTQAELEASYSKDNNLKSLSIEGFEITPEFNKDTLEYSAVVPEDTKEINIIATASDSRSSITGNGVKEVKQGANAFDIVVRAENGSEKTYKLSVEVKDSNPINVKVDNKELSVVKIKENLVAPNAYIETTVNISDTEIPAFYSEITKFTLVGLKDEEGNISLYIYNDGKYTKYNELIFDKITLYPKETNKKLDNYTKTTIEINGEKYTAYKLNKKSRFAIIYGLNVETGEEGFYTYDTKNNNAILYDSELIDILQNKITTYSFIIIGLLSALVILFIILIISLRKKSKKNKVKYDLFDNVKEENDTSIIEEKTSKKKKKKDDF